MVLASLIVAMELAISGTTVANLAIPAMGGVHLFIGFGEGLITAGALAFLYFTRPDLLKIGEAKPAGRVFWVAGFVIAVADSRSLSPLSVCGLIPTGPGWVAEQSKGFLG